MRVDKEIREKFFDENDESFEARKLWYSFKEVIFNENRFFFKHQLLEILKDYMSNNILKVDLQKTEQTVTAKTAMLLQFRRGKVNVFFLNYHLLR